MVLILNNKEKTLTKAFRVTEDYKNSVMEFFRENQGQPITKLAELIWNNAPNDNERAYGIFVLGHIVGANFISEEILKEKKGEEK
jgi:hypothetical protein